MIKIDNTLLQEIGLDGLPQQEKDSLLKHIYETLEMRVGMRLADQMTNQQLDEFERYFEAKDDAGAFKWLETNFPNYKDVVQEEFDKLKLEVQQAAPQILAAANAAGQPAIQQSQNGQPQQPYTDPNSATQPPAPVAQVPNPMVPPAQSAQPYPPQPAAFGAPAPAAPQPFAPPAPTPSTQDDWTQQSQQRYANPQPPAQDNRPAPQPQPYPDPGQSTQPPADPYAPPQPPAFPTQQPPPGYSS